MLQSPWQINLLGGFTVSQPARDHRVNQSKQTALLLAILADRVGRPSLRSDLMDELWPDVDPDVGRNRLRVLLNATRRVLEPAGTPSGSVLSCDRESVALAKGACWVDVDEFSIQVQMANQAVSRETRMERYKAADVLYQGDFLPGHEGEWVIARRAHYARLQCLAQSRFSALLEESGDVSGAMLQIARAIEADPLREAPRRRALQLLVQSNEVGSALAEYDTYRKLLKRSVGLAPTSEFQEWIKGLRSWAGSKKNPPSPGEESVAEPGLEIQSQPRRVVLPPPLNSFVGRAGEIGELSDLLPLYRWITLTGPGGIGKTRLAIETARANLSQFCGGVFFVPLTESANPSTFLETLLQQVQLAPSADPLETLRQFLAQPVESGRNACLFLLDGIDFISLELSQVILRVLTEIPNATVLSTSRKRRGGPGEYEYAIKPLNTPDGDPSSDSLTNPSVQLFLQRAQSASTRFNITKTNSAEVIELCRRLEGVPLAIELAAAQVGKASAGELLKRMGSVVALHDAKSWREPRHRSLQASLAISYDSLDEREQRVFCALCGFRGSFDAVAAGLVGRATPEDLTQLVEHSLITTTADLDVRRYSMLDMVRQYGWSRLSSSARTEIQNAHASYFRQMVADVETLGWSGGIQPLSKLRYEVENLRTAIEWTLLRKESEAAVRLSSGLSTFWIYAGFQQEGREYAHRIRSGLELNEVQSALLDAVDGTLASFQEDPDSGGELIRRALPILEANGWDRAVWACKWTMGLVAYQRGDYEEAIRCGSEMASVRDVAARPNAYRLNLLGIAHCELGLLDNAQDYIGQSESSFRELGDSVFADFCRLTLARITWKRGDLDGGWQMYLEVLVAFSRWKDLRGMAYAVEGLGRIAVNRDQFATATRLLGLSQRLRDSLGLRRDLPDQRAYEEAIDSARSGLGKDFDPEWKAGYSSIPENIPEWVEGLTGRPLFKSAV